MQNQKHGQNLSLFINGSLGHGHFGQIQPQVAKRTSTDVMLRDAWCDRRGEELRVEKESKRDRVTELVSILHIIALLIFSQLELAVAVLTACGVVGGVCVCVSICLHTFAHIVALTLVSGRKRKRRCCQKAAVNIFWQLVSVFGMLTYQDLQQLHDRSLLKRV